MMRQMIFFTLLLVSLMGLTLNAQDESEPTAAPIIEVVTYDDHVDFIFTFEGEEGESLAYIYIDNVLVARIQQEYPWGDGAEGPVSAYWVDRTHDNQQVEIQVQARAPGKDWSEMVYFYYTVPAQGITEQTSAPIIHERRDPDMWNEWPQCLNWWAIAFANTESESVTLYYRYHYTFDWSGTEVTSDWKTAYLSEYSLPEGDIVDPELLFEEDAYGWVEAYAKAEYKTESEHVMWNFRFSLFSSVYFSRDYDFKVNGIYYTKLTDSSVAVSKRTINKAAYIDNTYPSEYPETMYDDYVWDPSLLSYEYANPCYYGDITIPSTVVYGGKTYTVTAISDLAFENCEWMTSIQLPETLTRIGAYAFKDCTLSEIRIPESVIGIGTGAFMGCDGLTEITIPEGVTFISNQLFQDCENLTSVDIPDAVTSIGDEAFSYCTVLSSIDLPDALTSIGFNAFYYCTALTGIDLPDGVTMIEMGAFSFCENLTAIEIPAAVEEIGSRAFMGCSALNKVTCMGTVPPYSFDAFNYGDDDSWFIYDRATLFVPAESIEDYRTADEWGYFTHIVPFIGAGPGDINGDGDMTIGDVTVLISQVLGNNPPAYCDVNGDGEVTISDVTLLIKYVLTGD